MAQPMTNAAHHCGSFTMYQGPSVTAIVSTMLGLAEDKAYTLSKFAEITIKPIKLPGPNGNEQDQQIRIAARGEVMH